MKIESMGLKAKKCDHEFVVWEVEFFSCSAYMVSQCENCGVKKVNAARGNYLSGKRLISEKPAFKTGQIELFR